MRFRHAVLALIPMALAACATPQERVANQEDQLAAAGFQPRPANTPQRIAMLNTLPPNRFSMRSQKNTYIYIYPDPMVCGCVYFGDQSDYARYRQAMQARQLVNDQVLAAQLNQDTAWNWDAWGPWGGWW